MDTLINKEVNWYDYILQERRVLAEQTVEQTINVGERDPWCPGKNQSSL